MPHKKILRIGENVKTLRTAAGMTQLELAHKSGFAGPDAGAYVSRLEHGANAPRIETLQRIAKALKVGLVDLLETK